MDLSLPHRTRDATTYVNISQAALDNLGYALDIAQLTVSTAYNHDSARSTLRGSMISVALLSVFSGLLTVLTVVAVLTGIKRRAIMLVAIVVMWISTMVYWIATVVAAARAYSTLQDLMSQSVAQMANVQACLGLITGSAIDAAPSCQHNLGTEPSDDYEAYDVNSCTGTVSLMINVVIGDSIAWWRAWVLWPDSRVVRCICTMMIFLTTMAGALDTSDACRAQQWAYLYASKHASDRLGEPETGQSPAAVWFNKGTMLGGDVWGIVAALLSLLTNVAATSLIAYRVWCVLKLFCLAWLAHSTPGAIGYREHRRVIMSYLKGSSPRSQVERTLALLVESGLLYCVLWAVIVVYELGYLSPTLNESGFTYGFYYVMTGCLVPLIGMYPTLVVIVCAVDKSLHERSAKDDVLHSSILFHDAPLSSSRGRETLSELLSGSSACHDVAPEESGKRLSRTPKEELGPDESVSGSRSMNS